MAESSGHQGSHHEEALPSTSTQENTHESASCEETFIANSNQKSLEETSPLHEIYSCVCSNKKFTSRGDLLDHILYHVDTTNSKCLLCGKTCRSNSGLTNHVLRGHLGYKPKWKKRLPVKTPPEESKVSCKSELIDPGVSARNGEGEEDKSPGHLSNNFSRHCNLEGDDLRCVKCDKTFRNKSGLTRHLLHFQGHSDSLEFQCSECGERFQSRRRYASHLRVHTGGTPFVCDLCNRTFSSSGSLYNHKRSAHGGVYQCRKCEKRFTLLKLLTLHESRCEKTEFRCSECGERFQLKQPYMNHLKTHAEGKPFVCDLCNETFSSSGSLFYHKRSTHGGGYQCHKCDKRFTLMKLLKLHESHCQKIKFQCSECGERFQLKHRYMNHLKIHTGGKPFVCDLCNTAFAHVGSLYNHKRQVHGGVHQCSTCGKRFTLVKLLTLHRESHCEETKFQSNGPGISAPPGEDFRCVQCDKTFSNRGYLNRHLWHSREHSESRNVRCSGEKPIVCHRCNKTFPSSRSLYHHRRNAHDGGYKCPTCGERFLISKLLTWHLQSHHKNTIFQCVSCDKCFKQRGDLVVHARKHANMIHRFECPLCPERFLFKRMLGSHLFMHGVQKPDMCAQTQKLECPVCRQKFKTEKRLVNHLRLHSGEKPFRCEGCGKKFAVQIKLTSHKKDCFRGNIPMA